MRVENPRFDSEVSRGDVKCSECPFTDEKGVLVQRSLCCMWVQCPTAETYTAACLMAEEAAKGGKG